MLSKQAPALIFRPTKCFNDTFWLFLNGKLHRPSFRDVFTWPHVRKSYNPKKQFTLEEKHLTHNQAPFEAFSAKVPIVKRVATHQCQKWLASSGMGGPTDKEAAIVLHQKHFSLQAWKLLQAKNIYWATAYIYPQSRVHYVFILCFLFIQH